MHSSEQPPKDKTLDSTLELLQEGYPFIQKRCQQFQSHLFQTRLIGKEAFCISGEEAAELFYDSEKMQRHGAIPKRIQKSLFGENGVQTMDGEAHQHRKALFMSLMTPARLETLKILTKQEWENSLNKWVNKETMILFDEAQELLCRVACKWAGVPLKEAEVKVRARDYGNMVDAFGAVGPRHWRGRKARKREEEWIKDIIDKIRKEEIQVPEETAAYAMAFHRDLDGNLLDLQVAAVELINIVRPIVAIATYITFEALALYENPECLEKIRKNANDDYTYWFVQEVRRFYPFAPFLGANVKQDFEWQNQSFKKGTMVLLDLYGTTHDPMLWEEPDQFNPDRFTEWESSCFDLIPQGGGDPYMGHRCPGEHVTIDIMRVSVEFLANHMKYDVLKDQDLTVSHVKMPTLPESGFIMSNIRK